MPLTLSHRLKRKIEFDTTRAEGKKAVCASFVLHIRKTTPSGPTVEPIRRLGVVASKRVGNAVHRNRAKRVLREIFRLNPDSLPPHCDVILTARKSIFQFSFFKVQEDYYRLCKRLKRLL